MAKTAKGAGSGAIGKVAIIYGEVKAISPDGTVRILGPNSLVFADDQIITGSDGSVSLLLDGTPPIHLDLGRMTQIVLDEDVYGGAGTSADAAAEADKVQQALLAGDQPIEPEAPAAGGEASAGGGHPVVNYSLTGEEVTPDSGAETRGIGFGPLEVTEGDTVPIGGDDIGAVDDEGLIEGNLGGPDDNSDDPTNDAFIVGKLSYNFGADGPHPTEPFAWSMAGLPEMDITSHGYTLQYEVVNGGLTLNAFYIMEGCPGHDGPGDGDYKIAFDQIQIEPVRVDVFSLQITNVDTGAYKFTLFEPLDHASPATEDDINYIFGYGLKDGDGSTGSGVLRMLVDDDTPIMGERDEIRTVDEDDINNCQSDGNFPNDGPWHDGSFTGNPWYGHDHGPANIWGSLAGLVAFGADGPADDPHSCGIDAFSFAEENLDSLYEQELTSKGGELSYMIIGDTLYGYVPNIIEEPNGDGDIQASIAFIKESPVDGRIVFTLELHDSGHYQFSLFDQIDHENPVVDEVEDTLAVSEIPDGGENGLDTTIPIDFSGIIVATDFDGDPVTLEEGKFVINITDDAPIEAGCCPEVGIVEEEALQPGGNQEMNDWTVWVWNWHTWEWEPKEVDGWPDTAVAEGWLNSQVSVGADEPATFSLSEETCGLPQLTSNGEEISYQVCGNTLLAFIAPVAEAKLAYETNGELPPVEPRLIFTLTVDPNGHYTFTLVDQLDHNGCGEDPMCIDFSSMIIATDFDGDSITLNGNDFIIKIIDDMPVASANPTVVLDDDDVIGANGNPGGPNDDAAPINYKGILGHEYGADGPGHVDFASMNGKTAMVGTEEVTFSWDGGTNVLTATGPRGTLFTVEVTDPTTGAYTVTQLDNVLHTPPEITVNTGNYPAIDDLVKITVGVTHGDLDDVSVPHGATLKETGNGFGISSSVDNNWYGPDEINHIDPDWSHESEVMIFSLQGDAIATHATVDINSFYIREGGVGSEQGIYALYKDGVEVQGPTTFTANDINGDFTLNIKCLAGFDEIRFGAVRGTNDSYWGDSSDYYINEITFTDVTGENNALVDLTYTVSDYDGDHDHGTLTVNFDDDTPIAVDDCKATTAGEATGKTYNLMLILDTSGSMSDSQVQQEVDAMKALLNKYASIADGNADGVRVQIVSFASDATLDSPTPETIAVAIAHLDAIALAGSGGMTNYDAAVAQATIGMAAWTTATADHENLVYFVSDGEPNDGVIDDGEENAWEDTLDGVGATAWAIGVGASASDPDLADIAYPDSNVVRVEDFNDLLDGLIGTIAPQTATGNVMTNDFPGADGAEVTAVSYIDENGHDATAIVDDDGVTVQTQLGELFIESDGDYSYKSNPIELVDQQVTVNLGNTDLSSGIGASGMVKVSVVGDGTTSLIPNDGAFGVASEDGGNDGRYDEINYLGGGKSEAMIFELQGGKVAGSALVNISEFYSEENGVGNEVGSYELYLDGVKVQDATLFTASSKSGDFQLLIDGPECGGFDEIRFMAKEGTNASGGKDNSDYSIKSVTFDLNQQDVFHYEITDGDGDKSCADLTININVDTLIDDPTHDPT